MSQRGLLCSLALALLAGQLAHAACPALTVNFFPTGSTNVPAGWTREAQVEAGNEDSSSLNTITLAPTPTPKLFIQPEHPFFSKKACVPADCLPAKAGHRRRSLLESAASSTQQLLQLQLPRIVSSSSSKRLLQTCLTTVAAPAGYQILYNIDGGINKKATMPPNAPPFIALTTLDTLAPGKHTLNIMVTMLKQTAEVNSVSTLQPDADQEITTKVTFKLVEKLPAAAAEEEEVPAGKAAAEELPAAEEPAAAGKEPAAAKEPAAGKEPATDEPAANATAAEPAAVATGAAVAAEDIAPPIDATVTQQATKYYCMRQYNVGGRIHSNKTVGVGDAGVMECAVACNALGSACGGYGLTGKKCFLMKSFNTNSSAADATMDALCMKSANDWLDFGAKNADDVSAGFFCLRSYDLKGDPAGVGDPENPVQAANTEVAGMTPSTCATTCKGTAGCQYMLMKKPATAGGTATCYLKMHALGGLYGSTGPSTEIDYTCFNDQDAWLAFGGQLDYTIPSPEVNTGVETPTVASIAPALAGLGNDTGSRTYRCIKGYGVTGATIERVQVSLGDEGLTQCAQKCDDQTGNCVAYTMTEAGFCNLLNSANYNSSEADPRMYGLCFATLQDWNMFGNPDGSGFYCIKHYDFAGDGVRMVDYITITSGAAAVQFCKQQCGAEPQCQYVVTSLGKCYMKTNLLSGNFGTTRPDTAVDASCVKGEQNWALAALQVSATPPVPVGAGAANLTARRSMSLAQNGAGAAARPAWSCVLLLVSWMVAAAAGGGLLA